MFKLWVRHVLDHVGPSWSVPALPFTREDNMTDRQLRKKALRIWRRSFLKLIAFRYLLTPFGTIVRYYNLPDTQLMYRDYFIFGIRVARIHQV
jgi:hypothetical protein